MTTVAQALAAARASGVDRLDAHLLLARLLGQTRTWLLAHDDSMLDADSAARFAVESARRAAGEPLAYIVGEKEFHGLLLKVDPRVLIPRPDTEVLVDWALELARKRQLPEWLPPSTLRGSRLKAVDLGTGSGAIALAIKHADPAIEMLGTDSSAAALQVARANAARLGIDVAFADGSWWDAVPGRRFDLALSNPPYIAGEDRHLAALTHEPLQALTPGGDGLDSVRDLVSGAADHLNPGAWLLLEHGYDQASQVQELLRRHGFWEVSTRRDLAGQPRCTGGRCALVEGTAGCPMPQTSRELRK